MNFLFYVVMKCMVKEVIYTLELLRDLAVNSLLGVYSWENKPKESGIFLSYFDIHYLKVVKLK